MALDAPDQTEEKLIVALNYDDGSDSRKIFDSLFNELDATNLDGQASTVEENVKRIYGQASDTELPVLASVINANDFNKGLVSFHSGAFSASTSSEKFYNLVNLFKAHSPTFTLRYATDNSGDDSNDARVTVEIVIPKKVMAELVRVRESSFPKFYFSVVQFDRSKTARELFGTDGSAGWAEIELASSLGGNEAYTLEKTFTATKDYSYALWLGLLWGGRIERPISGPFDSWGQMVKFSPNGQVTTAVKSAKVAVSQVIRKQQA